jgi:hypothetical protein
VLPAESRLPRVQATVRTFDAGTRSGTVLLDDGTELPYDAAAFDRGTVRHLRSGQRVRIVVDGAAARVVALDLVTFPDPG